MFKLCNKINNFKIYKKNLNLVCFLFSLEINGHYKQNDNVLFFS